MMAGVGISPTPLFEQKDDPEGRRYAYGGAISISEDGTMEEEEVLFRLEREPLDPELLTNDQPDPVKPKDQKIGSNLEAQLESLSASETVRVELIAKSDYYGFQYDLERLVAEGLISSQEEWDAHKDALIEERLSEVAELNAPLLHLVDKTGGKVVSICTTRPCVAADVPAGIVAELAASPTVTRVLALDLDGKTTSANGNDVRHGHQIQQLLDQTYDGEGPTTSVTDDIIVAILEASTAQGGSGDQRYDSNHPAFKDTSGSALRRAWTATSNGWRWFCDATQSPVCDHGSFPSSYPEGDHQTQVAGLILGDFEDNQVSGLTAAEETAASGYAPEARGHFFLAANSTGYRESVDELPGIPSADDPPHIANMSVRYSTDCSGTDALSASVNAAYRDGIAMITAAGNEGGSSTNCTVGAPGTAIGAFTVGAMGHSSSAVQDPADIRTVGIWNESGGLASGWGGNNSEGQGRTLLDMVALGRRNSKIDPGGTIDSSTNISGLNATSHATATVTGAAASLMDSEIANGKTWIDHPGRLYAYLLVMGDRQAVSGKVNSRFDPLWGAGRLRMRMVRDGGLDAPSRFYRISTCIDDGETYTFNISNLSSDMNTVKVASFWFDQRHDGSQGSGIGSVANVDATLRSSSNDYLAADLDDDDNKTFMHYNTPSMPSGLKLELHGVDVSGHDFGCGNDSIMVHTVIFVEDSDRESPTYNAATGEGVAPEHL